MLTRVALMMACLLRVPSSPAPPKYSLATCQTDLEEGAEGRDAGARVAVGPDEAGAGGEDLADCRHEAEVQRRLENPPLVAARLLQAQ